MPDHTPFKRCTKCGVEYPATPEYFHRHKNHGRVGLRPECKRCTSLMQGHTYTPPRKFPECPPGYQYCRSCGLLQPVDIEHFAFLKDKSRFSLECRICTSIRVNKWNAANPSKRKSRGERRRKKHATEEKARKQKYQKEHPEKVNAVTQRYRARKRGLPATFTATDWQRALDYFDNRCAVCGRPRGLWHTLAQDHWIPVALGGGYTPDNIVPLCDGIGGCNESKNKHHPHSWLIAKFGMLEAQKAEAKVSAYFEWIKKQ